MSFVGQQSPSHTLAIPLVLCVFLFLLQPSPSVLRDPGGAVCLCSQYYFCLECCSPEPCAQQTLIHLSGLTEVTSFLEFSHRCSVSSSSSPAVNFTVDYSLLLGVVYILNLGNTLLETVVYIFPSYPTVIFSSTGAVSFVRVLGLDALCLLGGRCLLQSLERRRSLLPLRENNCLNETNFLFLLSSDKAGKKVEAGGHLGDETRWRETSFKGSLQLFQPRASPSHCRNALSCSPFSDLLEAPNITANT